MLRRADAKPLIQELNVGDAAEPQGRGTGQPPWKSEQKTLDNIIQSDISGSDLQRNTTVQLFCRAVQWKLSACFGQVELWQTWMGTDSWICCWHMERAPGSQSLSSRSRRCVCACQWSKKYIDPILLLQLVKVEPVLTTVC